MTPQTRRVAGPVRAGLVTPARAFSIPTLTALVTLALWLGGGWTFGAVTESELIAAIIAVESGGNDHAIGDGGKAHGPMQIHPVMVAECNRIVGSNRWTLADRMNRAKSVEMFLTYSRHYSTFDAEGWARRWNGGPTGHKKTATLAYWRKVQQRLAK